MKVTAAHTLFPMKNVALRSIYTLKGSNNKQAIHKLKACRSKRAQQSVHTRLFNIIYFLVKVYHIIQFTETVNVIGFRVCHLWLRNGLKSNLNRLCGVPKVLRVGLDQNDRTRKWSRGIKAF